MKCFVIFSLVCAGLFSLNARPLSEVVKDIEVSGEARYRFENVRKKTEIKTPKPKQETQTNKPKF